MKYYVETEFARKCENIEQVRNEISDGLGEYADFDITTVFELSHDDFIKFQNNLLADYTFIKGFETEVFIVVEKGQKIKSGLVIDPQGFGYARYVGEILSIDEIKNNSTFVSVVGVNLEEVA